MLEPHSLLWHYLWLGPHILQALLAILLWRRGLHKQFPIFFSYLVFEALEEFTLYGMDILPSISVRSWWVAFYVGLIIEGALKLGVIGELFSNLLRPRATLARIGGRLISCSGAILVLLAALAAAYIQKEPWQYIWTYRSHVLLQSLYLVEGGLILFVFAFAAHFELTWDRSAFGIAIGFGVLFCEHMGAWAVMASGHWLDNGHLVDFLNNTTYHLCVLIWCYYLLIPQKKATTSAVALPENDLAMWNRELERLLQR